MKDATGKEPVTCCRGPRWAIPASEIDLVSPEANSETLSPDYTKEREKIFTLEGVSHLLKVCRIAETLCQSSGAVTAEAIMNKAHGSAWMTLNALDVLVECGTLIPANDFDQVAGQERCYMLARDTEKPKHLFKVGEYVMYFGNPAKVTWIDPNDEVFTYYIQRGESAHRYWARESELSPKDKD